MHRAQHAKGACSLPSLLVISPVADEPPYVLGYQALRTGRTAELGIWSSASLVVTHSVTAARALDALCRASGLFVPKPSSQTSVVRILVSSLGLSVRQRPLVYVGVRGDRHSVSHSACEPVRAAACGSPPGARVISQEAVLAAPLLGVVTFAGDGCLPVLVGGHCVQD